MKKVPLLSVSCLLFVVVVTVALTSRNGKIDQGRLVAVERGDIVRSVIASGKIEPLTEVDIQSKASGIVKQLLVEVNARVKRGQPLVELDKAEMQAALRQAEAGLASAKAARQGARAELDRLEVDAQGVEIPMLQRAYERAGAMEKEGMVSKAILDESERTFKTAVNRRDAAVANLNVARAKIAQAEAQVQQAAATLDQTREQLRYATIVSPIDGIVLSRSVTVGRAVSSIFVMGSAATRVMTVGDTSQVFVRSRVDESDIGNVYIGQAARIKVESYKGQVFAGRVMGIAPRGDERDNVTTFEVDISVENPRGELKPAMTANTEIVLEEHRNVLLLPEAGLTNEAGNTAWVEVPDTKTKDGKRRVEIKIGISNGAKAELMSGLKENDKVILPN
jgi:HlyD family secretion protein